MDTEAETDPVLDEVEDFLRHTPMTATAFGHQALNDPRFVHDLRKGRECKRATRARVHEFIAMIKAAAQSEQAA